MFKSINFISWHKSPTVNSAYHTYACCMQRECGEVLCAHASDASLTVHCILETQRCIYFTFDRSSAVSIRQFKFGVKLNPYERTLSTKCISSVIWAGEGEGTILEIEVKILMKCSLSLPGQPGKFTMSVQVCDQMKDCFLRLHGREYHFHLLLNFSQQRPAVSSRSFVWKSDRRAIHSPPH